MKLIRATHADRLVVHIARDGSAIVARERFVDIKPKKTPKAKGKKAVEEGNIRKRMSNSPG